MSSMDLPQAPEEITAAWLTEILSATYPDARAREVELVDAHSGTTGRARIRVAWEGDAPAEALFVKLPPTNEISRQMVLSTGMGRREARFYQHVAAEVPVRVPRPLWSASNEEGSSYFMLLEDLEAAGCIFPSADDPGLLSLTESLMVALGRLHGSYAISPDQPARIEGIEPPMKNDWGKILVESALTQFEAEMPPEFSRLGRLYLEENEGFQDLLESGPSTLIHGDPHIGNLFLEGSTVGFLDWACTAVGVGMRDVAYFLCNSTPPDFRREHQSRLLGMYRESLDAAGTTADPAEMEEDYRRFAAYAWIAAVTTLAAGDRMQSLEIGRAATERANQAIRDLSTFEYFRERL